MDIFPCSKCSLKCQFSIDILGSLSDFRHSCYCYGICVVFKHFQCTFVWLLISLEPFSIISSLKLVRGITVHSPLRVDISSAYVMLRATSICILDAHVTGHVTTYAVLDFEVALSTCSISALQLLQKSASKHNSIILPFICL